MSWRDTVRDAEPVTSSWRDTIADAEPTAEPVPVAASAIQGLAKGASANFLDEIAGGLEAAGSAVGIRGLGGSFEDLRLETDEEDKQSLKEIYQQARDAKREALKESEEQNPIAFGAGELGGGVALGAATPLNPATVKGATALGAGMGATQAVGASESESTLDMIKEALKGGALGGVFGFAGGKAAQALKPTAKAARDQAARSAYRTTGGLKSDINKLYNMAPEDVGNELLDRGLIKLGTKRGSTNLADDIGEELSKFRSGQDKLISGLDEAKPKSFDVGKIVQKLEAQADEFANMGGAGNRSYANALRKEAEILTETGKKNISLAEALKLKRAFDQGGKFQSPLSEASAVEAARAARSTIKKEIDDAVSSIAGPQVTKAYEQTRQGASRLMSAKDALGQAEKRDIANKTFGLTDLLAGGGGAVIGAASGGGGAVGLAAGVAANKLISNYGASTTAVMLKKASDILAKEGLAAGTRKLSAMYGADMAGTLTEALQEQKVNNKSEAVRDYLKGTRGQ